MKRKVVLTETKLRKVVKNIITEILVNKAYDKFYSDIPQDVYKKITSVDDTRGKHLGPYAKWIIELYRKDNFNLSDIGKVKKYVDIFERMSKAGKLKGVNINTFSSVSDMYDLIKGDINNDTITKGEKIRKQKDDGIDRVYEDDEWLVVIPKTHEASCLYGANTKWCTASEGKPNYFERYSSKGALYILINKKANKKYQIHFEDDLFMDELDNKINVRTLELPEDLINAIVKGNIKKKLRFKYDKIHNFKNGIAQVELDDKHNFMNGKGELLSPNQWFDWATEFENGFTAIFLKDKWNFMSEKGELLSPNQWFDNLYGFYKGVARVEIDDKYNLITQNGKLISNQWFDGINHFKDRVTTVKLNDKYNFINKNGEIISNQWFDDATYYGDGLARVKMNDKLYNLNLNNGIISVK